MTQPALFDDTRPGSATVLRGNALALPLADDSVDLVVTSPPYFGLRSYRDGGEHYDGQIGSEATPAEFVDALIAATAEMVRVVKPSGSIWVNLGDKYAGNGAPSRHGQGATGLQDFGAKTTRIGVGDRYIRRSVDVPTKSLIGVPWRYALRCIDDLGLILRAEVIWSKPNGLPESVTDRVRRSHETWFHFTLNPRYYSAVDEIREEHDAPGKVARDMARGGPTFGKFNADRGDGAGGNFGGNPLGKLPGSVWTIPTQPLTVPPELGVDHFAAFPMEWPRLIVTGWSPREVCTVCGEGRRPVVDKETIPTQGPPVVNRYEGRESEFMHNWKGVKPLTGRSEVTVTGYACACPDTTAPATPGVVLDPFGGTGTTATVARALGRDGITVDMSADYCRVATWRTNDPKQLARATRPPNPPKKPATPKPNRRSPVMPRNPHRTPAQIAQDALDKANEHLNTVRARLDSARSHVARLEELNAEALADRNFLATNPKLPKPVEERDAAARINAADDGAQAAREVDDRHTPDDVPLPLEDDAPAAPKGRGQARQGDA